MKAFKVIVEFELADAKTTATGTEVLRFVHESIRTALLGVESRNRVTVSEPKTTIQPLEVK